MTDKTVRDSGMDVTIEKMNRRRWGFKDYVIYFLLALIVFGWMGYEARAREMDTRLEDHRAFVDGLAGLNEDLKMEMVEQITDQVITLFYKDIRMQEYNDGWDKGYGDCAREGNGLHNLDGGVE